MKLLGPIQRCLEINVRRDKKRGIIEFSQLDYVAALPRNFDMNDCQNTTKPIEPNGGLCSDVTPS